MIGRPGRDEAAAYYLGYADRITDDDVVHALEAQFAAILPVLSGIDEERSRSRYAADKWTLRQVLGHINDTERLFVSRAFWIARGFTSPLPSFDQNTAVAAARSDDIPWARHVEEFERVRPATIAFFRNLPEEAWLRRGIASDNPFTVRALAYLAAGHVDHHMAIVRERYL